MNISRTNTTFYYLVFVAGSLVCIVFAENISAGEYRRINDYPFLFEVPVTWLPVSQSELSHVRITATENANSLYKQYAGINEDTYSHIPYAAGYYSPSRKTKLLILLTRFRPIDNYMDNVKADVQLKIEFGRKKGIIQKVHELSFESVNGFDVMILDFEMRDRSRAITALLYDPKYSYQVVSISYFFSGKRAKEARTHFKRLVESFGLDFTVNGSVGNESFVISNRCQQYWIVTDMQTRTPQNVVLVLQEPHWDYVGHWNLRRGLTVFFQENPHLHKKSIFLAEGAKSLEPLSIEPLVQVEPHPDEKLIRAVLQSYLITGYMSYDWEIGGATPIVGTEDWPVYQESVRLWLRSADAPWAVTVAARNHRMVETLIAMRQRYANPMLFVGGMHLHKINSEIYNRGHAALPANSKSAGRGNHGIIDLLKKRGVHYIYIESTPGTDVEMHSGGIAMERYRDLFHVQQKGDYRSYIAGFAKAIREIELLGRNPFDGVTVTPNPVAAANLVSALKEGESSKENGSDSDEEEEKTSTGGSDGDESNGGNGKGTTISEGDKEKEGEGTKEDGGESQGPRIPNRNDPKTIERYKEDIKKTNPNYQTGRKDMDMKKALDDIARDPERWNE